MIDEASRRRPDWVEGIAIRLEDGQEWHFPRPVIELRIGRSESGGYGGLARKPAPMETNRRYGERFWMLHEGLLDAVRDEDPDATLQAYGALAHDLLIRNYDLSIEDVEDLLVMIPDDDANMEMWKAIVSVAMGRAHKTRRRWLRLSAILAGGSPDRMYLEDAEDLAEWQSAPAAIHGDAVVPPSRVPRFVEWCPEAALAASDAATDSVLNSMMG